MMQFFPPFVHPSSKHDLFRISASDFRDHGLDATKFIQCNGPVGPHLTRTLVDEWLAISAFRRKGHQNSSAIHVMPYFSSNPINPFFSRGGCTSSLDGFILASNITSQGYWLHFLLLQYFTFTAYGL